jgi:hypothetical protein
MHTPNKFGILKYESVTKVAGKKERKSSSSHFFGCARETRTSAILR